MRCARANGLAMRHGSSLTAHLEGPREHVGQGSHTSSTADGSHAPLSRTWGALPRSRGRPRASVIHLKIMAPCLVAASSYIHRLTARCRLGRIRVPSLLGFSPSCSGIPFSPTTIWAPLYTLMDSALVSCLVWRGGRVAVKGSSIGLPSYRMGVRALYTVMLTPSPVYYSCYARGTRTIQRQSTQILMFHVRANRGATP